MSITPIANVEAIAGHARDLLSTLRDHRNQRQHPERRKSLRTFTSTEAARLLGVNDGYLRRLSLEKKGPLPGTGARGKRLYSDSDIHALREYLDATGKGSRRYLPKRRGAEKIQIISVVNPKDGVGNTTTVAHLCQHLALHGYRVLAVDLDPFANLSSLCGVRTTPPSEAGQTLVGSIVNSRLNGSAREIAIPTIFSNLDILPGDPTLLEFDHLEHKRFCEQETHFTERVASIFQELSVAYDVIVVDHAARLGAFGASVLTNSTALLFPVYPDPDDVAVLAKSVELFSSSLSRAKSLINGGSYDWVRYLVTRFDIRDSAHIQTVSMLRLILGDYVMRYPLAEIPMIAQARASNRTLYEIARESVQRLTYDRTMEGLHLVNSEIEEQIRLSWGR